MSWMEQFNKNKGKGISAMFSTFMKGSEVDALAADSDEKEIPGIEAEPEHPEHAGYVEEVTEREEAPVENAVFEEKAVEEKAVEDKAIEEYSDMAADQAGAGSEEAGAGNQAAASESVGEDQTQAESGEDGAEQAQAGVSGSAVEEQTQAESGEDRAEQAQVVSGADAGETEGIGVEETSSSDPLDKLEPSDVFHYFREISAIPHGSFHTEQISDYLEGFAKDRGLGYVRDEVGNLIISRPGSLGREEEAPVALQGHVDMVLEKEASLDLNMETCPISLCTDGEWLWADRTTLGGDDGIAVAIMLALLADETISCPPLECIFTVNEEVGLLGAAALDLSSLKSRRMINLDSEEEGIITAACAGGAEQVCKLAGRRTEKKGRVLELSVSGLRGGHSGQMIGTGRANADLVLARLLYRLREKGKYCIVSFNGGTKDNAIPRSARAEIIFTEKISGREIKNTVAEFAAAIRKEYHAEDPDISIKAKWAGKDRRIAFTGKDSSRMVRFLMALPNGVLEYLPFDRDIPQTSLSLGIVKTMADGLLTSSLVRSGIDSQKQMLIDKIKCIADQFGADVETRGAYPAWEYREKSKFRELAADSYRHVTGREAKISVTHGGLECGLLAAKVPGLDCISIGPDMEEIHTPGERLNIPSSARTYDFVKEFLKDC